jgi:hypothetical protein
MTNHNCVNCFATCLAKIVQKYPELRELVKVWPDLPEDTKMAIRALVQTHKPETK